jgi:hypothetical protein
VSESATQERLSRKPTTLGAIVAIERGVKQQTQSAITQSYHAMQKAGNLLGISKTYEKIDDDAADLPPESKPVQLRVFEELPKMRKTMTRLFDVVATKDDANTRARADIIVDGRTLVRDVPATTLLFLEKYFDDELATCIRSLAVLDPAQVWHFSGDVNAYVTDPIRTHKSQKIPRNNVKAWPTRDHPNIVPQVETYYEDKVVGYWTTIHQSGAVPAKQVREYLDRLWTLREAVKFARERANQTPVTDQKIGQALLDWLFR